MLFSDEFSAAGRVAIMAASVEEVSSSLVREYLSRKVRQLTPSGEHDLRIDASFHCESASSR